MYQADNKNSPAANPDPVYVQVKADFQEDGTIYPREILWKDYRVYEIDLVLDIKQAGTAKTNTQDDRYTVLIKGQRKHLFFERNLSAAGNNIGRWYVVPGSCRSRQQ